MPRLALLLATLLLTSAASAQMPSITRTSGAQVAPIDRFALQISQVDDVEHANVQTMPFSGSPGNYNTPSLVVPDGAWVTQIDMGERSDRPCSIKLHWRTIDDGAQRTGSVDWGCTPRRSSVKTLRVGNHSGSLGAIEGLRVCQRNSNDRLKGLEIGGATITGLGSTYATVEGDGVKRDFERPNCNDWEHAPQVCEAGKVLIGVDIAHAQYGRNPQIKGLAPICANLLLERD